MKNFVTSDLHFGHSNILKYCPRPYLDVKDMDETLIMQFQERVGPEDHVYHLGDFMFGRPKLNDFLELFERLPGNWHFILGNHDRHTLEKWKPQLLNHDRIEEIDYYKRLVLDDTCFILFHYELAQWDLKHWRRHPEDNRRFKAVYHLYGHTHSEPNTEFVQDARDVGIDATEYQILTFDEIVSKYFEKKPLTNLDDLLY